jgi:FecR protein/Putative zinc-finger
MTHKDNNLDQAIEAMRADEPSSEELRGAAGRLFQKLTNEDLTDQPEVIKGCEDVRRLLPALKAGQLPNARALVVEAHLRECMGCRSSMDARASAANWVPTSVATPTDSWNRLWVAAAAAVVVIAAFFIHNAYFAVPAGARATVQSLDGSAFLVTDSGVQPIAAGAQLYQGNLLRTSAGAHAFLRLADNSIVEVRERSEFSLSARGKDASIDLDRGSVLVQAAKRSSGHLYVRTPDCRVAVAGTVFSVDSGLKGSRVSVIEGTVDVTHDGSQNILHAGDQVSTGENMSPIPVAEDIAWSKDRAKHLELLAQFSKLQRKLAEVPMPAPRFNSSLAARMPADAIFFVSLPNAGQALEDAHRIMKEQIQQSPELRQWWTHGDAKSEAKMDLFISKLRALSDYLGDEIDIVGIGGKDTSVAAVATLRRSDLAHFLSTQFASDDMKVQVISEQQIGSVPEKTHSLIAVIRPNEVIFGVDRATLERIDAQLNSGKDSLGNTEFGQTIQKAYDRGAGFLLAADLHRIMLQDGNHKGRHRTDRDLERTGFGDMRYLILEHRELNGVPDNRMVLDFAGERKGIASWLANPGPMGSLDFVSPNAAVAVSFLTKEPELMWNDILAMDSGNPAKRDSEIADAQTKLNLRIKEDLVSHFGGDGAFALDGPVLPTPSWKLIVEVHDPAGLIASIDKVVKAINEEAAQKGKPGIELTSENAGGQLYYTVQSRKTGAKPMYFTFDAGYMIFGPDRAVLMNALRTQASGESLARSVQFKNLLPKDQNANYSAVAYQNLGPILQPLLSQFTGEQAKALQELAADSKPSVICVRGEQNQIEASTNSRLLGFDWLTMASLLEGGTKHGPKPY